MDVHSANNGGQLVIKVLRYTLVERSARPSCTGTQSAIIRYKSYNYSDWLAQLILYDIALQLDVIYYYYVIDLQSDWLARKHDC